MSSSAVDGIATATKYPLERRRFAVLSILWLSNCIFWASWFAQAPLLKSYWGVANHVSYSDAQYLISAVNIVAIFTVFASGYLYDRIGPRKGTTLMLIMIVIGFGLRPLAVHSFSLTLLLTIVAGCGQPLNSAAAPVVSQWFGHHRMAVPLAIAMTSVAVGQGAGQISGATMVSTFGAAGAFAIFSGALIVCLVGWLLIVPNGPTRPAGPPGPALPPLRRAFTSMMKTRGAWTFAMLGAVYTGILTGNQSLLPGMLEHTFHISPQQGGLDTATFGAAEIVGMLVIGYRLARSPRLARNGFWISIAELLCWLLMTAVFYTAIGSLALVLLVLAACGFFFLPNFVFALTAMERLKMAGSQTAGIAAGFYFTIGNAGGFILPTIEARIVDATSDNVGLICIVVMAAVALGLWASALYRRNLMRDVHTPAVAAARGEEGVSA
jgi:nitrate/nitrite transporter NarK